GSVSSSLPNGLHRAPATRPVMAATDTGIIRRLNAGLEKNEPAFSSAPRSSSSSSSTSLSDILDLAALSGSCLLWWYPRSALSFSGLYPFPVCAVERHLRRFFRLCSFSSFSASLRLSRSTSLEDPLLFLRAMISFSLCVRGQCARSG